MANLDELLNRAADLFDKGDKDGACMLAEQALELDADCAIAYQVLGMTYSSRHEPYQAIELLTHALSLKPDMVPALCDLGVAHTLLGENDAAIDAFEAALRLCPDHVSSRFNLAQVWLQQGRFEEGWQEFEWRWQTGQVARPELPRPRWDGREPVGKSILVHSEQGMGDTIQFVRLLPLLKERGARVVFACQKPLHRLLNDIDGVDEWYPIDQEAPITFDWVAALMSLPGLLGIHREERIPRDVPYIYAEPERIELWRQKLASLPGLKVGLNWRGKSTYTKNRLRSIPFEKLAPLAQEGVSLISLHRGEGEADLEAHRELIPVTVFPDLDADAPFVDTAAIMRNLDLIITSDTVTPHLAGALGCPVWLALSTSSDWRFLEGRADSPWYPTMRIFRQNSFNRWEPVIERIAKELRREKAKAQSIDFGEPSAMPEVPVSAGELIDKITILQIKSERIHDEQKLENVRRELQVLQRMRAETVPDHPDLEELVAELKQVNEKLWEIEDNVRTCEREGDFGERFIELARSVYKTNDHRAVVKRRMNELLGSNLVEEKSYVD